MRNGFLRGAPRHPVTTQWLRLVHHSRLFDEPLGRERTLIGSSAVPMVGGGAGSRVLNTSDVDGFPQRFLLRRRRALHLPGRCLLRGLDRGRADAYVKRGC
jgi:hypothetical protein